MKNKIFTLALAILLLLCPVLSGCSNSDAPVEIAPETTTPAANTPDNTPAAVEYLKSFYLNEAGTATAVDFTRFSTVRLDKESFNVTWTASLGEDMIRIVPGENGMVTIDINEECKVDTPYTLTATVTDAAGHSSSHSWDHILPAGMDMVATVEAAYQLPEGKSMENEVTLTGKVIAINNIFNPDFQNITVTIAVSGIEDKPIMCYRLKGDGAKDLAIGNIITVSGIIKNYSGTIEFDSGCMLTKVEKGDAVTALTDPIEILQAAYALEKGAMLPYQVTLTGTVTEIRTPYNPEYYNISVVMTLDGAENMPLLCYRLKGDGVEWLAVGDKITVTGMILNYNGTIEFNAGSQMTQYLPGGKEIPPSDDEAQILSDLSQLAQGQKLPYVATLTGKVISIDYAYDPDYNNITVTIDVNGTNIQCFRLTGAGIEQIAVGDTITVTGNMENYGGKLEFSAKSNLDSRTAG